MILEYLFERIPVTLVNHYAGYFVMGYVLSWMFGEKKIKKARLD